MNDRIYVAEISGKIKPSAEIRDFVWLSREEFAQKKYPMIPSYEEKIFPDLITKGEWK